MSCAVARTCPSGGRRTIKDPEPSETSYVRLDLPPLMWRAVSPSDAPGTWSANHAPSRGRSRPGTSLIGFSTRLVRGHGREEAGDERGERRPRAGGIGV